MFAEPLYQFPLRRLRQAALLAILLAGPAIGTAAASSVNGTVTTILPWDGVWRGTAVIERGDCAGALDTLWTVTDGRIAAWVENMRGSSFSHHGVVRESGQVVVDFGVIDGGRAGFKGQVKGDTITGTYSYAPENASACTWKARLSRQS